MIGLLASGSAFAQRGRGGGGGGGGGDGNRGGGDGGMSRSFSGNSGNSGRSMSMGSSNRSGDGGSFRSFSSRSSDGNRDGGSSRSMFRSSDEGRRSSDSVRTFRSDGDSGRSMGSTDGGRRDYTARRPSEGEVRNFLGDRDGGDRNRGDFDRDRGDRDRNRGDFDRGDRGDRGDRDRGDRDGGDMGRDRGDRDRGDRGNREYSNWKNTWNGRDGSGRDNRDWSDHWRRGDRFDVADRIRRDWSGRRDRDFPFAGDWWRGRHGNHWSFWGDRFRDRPWYWWSWATGARLGSWFVFDWSRPYYWDYGPGEYIYCDDGAVYVNGRWYEPQPVYYDQTVNLIDQSPELTAESAARQDWMPLGVFAVTPDGRDEPIATVQLAVTKDGVIGGTAYDQQSGQGFNIRGTVDKRSQRAVWSYTDDRDKRLMMETSIYNLTQPEATGLVHYSPTDMRTVELVRLEQPSSSSTASSTSDLPTPSSR